MKIVYCIAGTYRSGGMERVLANKANYLVSKGHDVTIITTDQRGQKPFFTHDPKIKFHDLGINYELNNGKSIFHKLAHYPAKQRKHKKLLNRLLHKIKADIVVSMFCNEVSFITRIKDGSSKILEIHFSKFKRLQYGRKGLWHIADEWRTKQDEKLVKLFDKFVVLTKEDKSYWGNLPNIQVIPNSISKFPESTSDLIHKTVIAVGRFSHQKNFEALIDIWSEVCKQNNDWQLKIIGDGEEKRNIQKQIKNYGIEDRVRLLPPTNEIEKEYLTSSILVLTSRYEGLPMILIEAQSFGLPIVAYTCKCGPKDVISDGKDGFLVDENDKQSFTQRLLQLINNDELRKQMGFDARRNSTRFSEEKIMQQWIELFENVK